MAENLESKRYRNWCAIIYPSENWYKQNRPDGPYDGHEGWGSAPDDWKNILDNLGIRWACSPLHDLDVDDDGLPKKPHWHIVLCYSGKKSFDQVCDDLKEFNCPIPKYCRDLNSSVRYFIHRDHPHKYQYSESDIESYGGLDVEDCFKFSKSEVNLFVREMTEYCLACEVTEFSDFSNYCLLEKTDSWFKVLTDSKTLYFSRLIASIRHKRKLGNNSDYENE